MTPHLDRFGMVKGSRTPFEERQVVKNIKDILFLAIAPFVGGNHPGTIGYLYQIHESAQ